ncbi:MAG: Smr/MutS family protein, partial [Balneolaceae bacterium]
KKAEEVVPLDLEITRQEKGLLISGPNAGGKSVALKTVGILAIMYQSGIPLPLQPHSELPVISGLFLDMGDEQSIENDLSTFSSRLKWMKDTLQKVDGNSLVLIDEAGTGTDPHEGGALFQAFMEILLDHQANLIATTHHSALKVFAHDHPLLANGAMEFDQETLTPTYRFRKGIPGSSYAFEIAGRMKLPPDLLRASRKLLGSQRDRMAELLLDLEQRLQDTEESRRQYEDLRKKAGKQEEIYNEKIRQLEEQRNSKLNEAYQEADRIMKDANRMIEQAVENISMKGKTDRDYVSAERRRVSEHKKKIRKRLAELNAREDTGANRPAENGLPEIGDRVRISGGNTTGELIEKEGNRAVVMAGGLKIKTRFGNLEKAEASGENKADRWKASSYTKTFSQEPVSPSLDLRGMRGEEAIRELMLYLDRAIAGGLNEVQVIHGKGEGILKKLVHEYLDKRKEVRTFGMAPWERGGPGCTEVSFE